jgi:DNA-binding transcriptional LysR family regulator
LYEQALEMLQTLQSARTMLRAHSSTAQDVIEFAMPHTLAFTFFPGWLSSLAEPFGPVKSRVTALNVHDAVMRLTQGGCDLLIAFHHPAQPLQLDPKRYEMLPLGRETMAPYVKPTAQGAPMFALPASGSAPQPYLAYAPGAYLAGVAEHVIKQSPTPLHLERVYETDMSEGLKAMALEGHGIAFLPASAVRQELRQNKLVPAMPGLEASIDIRVYRERSQPGQAVGAVEPLWQHLLAHPLAAI